MVPLNGSLLVFDTQDLIRLHVDMRMFRVNSINLFNVGLVVVRSRCDGKKKKRKKKIDKRMKNYIG